MIFYHNIHFFSNTNTMKIILLCLSLVISPFSALSPDFSDSYFSYNEYKNFKKEDYDRLEKMRILNNYTHLETINIYYTQSFIKAKFPNHHLTLTNKFFKYESTPTSLVSIDEYKIMYPSILKTTKDGMLLDKETLHAYIKMIDELSRYYDCMRNLYIFSGYRDLNYQKTIYDRSLDKSYVAYPGYSEHHTGLAIDISNLNFGLTKHFEDSQEFKILSQECAKYGFILRYQKDKIDITGYSYEPWHFRYVGVNNSLYMYKHNLTLEEYILQNFEL